MSYELINGIFSPDNLIVNDIPNFNYDDIIKKAHNQLISAYSKLKESEHSFKMHFKLHYKGKFLGQCTSYNLGNDTHHTISIHADLFKPENKWKLDNTVKHELTHALIFMVFGNFQSPYYSRRVKPHGREFRYFGRAYFGEELNTTCKDPSIKLTAARKLVRFVYDVPTHGEVQMTKQQHAKLQQGVVYRLRSTNQQIKLEHYKEMIEI
jgi:predicted SprT family Zn-dependent metalloprotease